MTKGRLLLLLILSHFLSEGQITIMGHSLINNKPINNTNIFVKVGGVTTKTLNTAGRSDFKLELPFGNVYQVFFQNTVSPLMYMEVIGNTVPADKYRYLMTYELNIPFVNKQDEDVDTTVFVKPFYKIFFNGQNRMVDDTAYNAAFENSVIKKNSGSTASANTGSIAAFSGKIQSASGTKYTANKKIVLKNASGQLTNKTLTNRLGGFCFTNVNVADAESIVLETGTAEAGNLVIVNSENDKPIINGHQNGTNYEWTLNSELKKQLIGHNANTIIGGKLISSSPRKKDFYAGKTVYLLNKMNTVIQKTKTNTYGTFVFQEIKPDKQYYIATDKSEIPQGAKIDLLTKDDKFITSMDTLVAGRMAFKLNSSPNKIYNQVLIGEEEVKMEVKATIFGDNVNNPIGKLKILLLNDNYEVIDSAVTDNFGAFKFKYLPFIKRFYLSAENTDNVLDVFKNILIYSSDDNLIKIMMHQKGSKFTYNPVSAELSSLREIELEDPTLELAPAGSKDVINESPLSSDKKERTVNRSGKLVVENILFEPGHSDITPQAKTVLDKVVQVLIKNPSLKIEVGAHTDSKGSADANLKLSEDRAKTVQKYITSAKINASRIAAKGYGETQLLNHCDDAHDCSENEHAQNRRIEFKILGEESKQ